MYEVSCFDVNDSRIVLVLSNQSRIELERNDSACKRMINTFSDKLIPIKLYAHPFYLIYNFKTHDENDRDALLRNICKYLDSIPASLLGILDVYEDTFDDEWSQFFKKHGFQNLKDEVIFRPAYLETQFEISHCIDC